ncbi:MAG: hypothetical protein H6595_06885 [Flavobacteriales bacterium]|nr:hypothetical protein [Flavobacteriales bacterium]MCB9167190.1 hypothetical protein [Flavobacteriales bacterium]
MRTTLTLIGLLCTIGAFAQARETKANDGQEHTIAVAKGPATGDDKAVVWDFPRKSKGKKNITVEGEGPSAIEPGDLNLLFHGMTVAPNTTDRSR